MYLLHAFGKHVSGSSSIWAVGIQWLDESKTPISGVSFLIGSGTSWAQYQADVISPSTARFAYFRVYDYSGVGTASVAGFDAIGIKEIADIQPAWEDASGDLVNSWANAGGGHTPVGYYMAAGGIVHLRGLVSGGTSTDGTEIFTLATGWRPAYTWHFVVYCENGSGNRLPAVIAVNPDGTVRVYNLTGTIYNTYLSLDGISFDTRT
jgi:hypothetical protein